MSVVFVTGGVPYRLKINRSDVHFGYRPVRGSGSVYKAELNGEIRAAKVKKSVDSSVAVPSLRELTQGVQKRGLPC